MKPVIRCSSLDRLLGCSGSRTLVGLIDAATVDIGEADGDEMTWRGNWAHYEAALRLIREHGAIGKPDLPVLPLSFTPDDRDRAMVAWYVESVLSTLPADHQPYVETRVTMEFPRFFLTGQIDAHSVNPDITAFTLEDLKTGMFEVDHAEDNWQLTGYATLVKYAHPTLRSGVIRIHQKHAETPVTEAIVENLDGLATYLEGKINASLDAFLALETGHKQCRLCPAIFFCPAIDAELTAMKYLLTEDEIGKLNTLPSLKDFAQVAARAHAIGGPAKKIIERLRERIDTEGPVVIADGTTIKLVEENGARAILHTRAAHLVVAAKIGEDAAWDALSISPSDIEDQLHKSGAVKFKDSKSDPANSAKGWVRQNMGHLITQPKIKKLKFA